MAVLNLRNIPSDDADRIRQAAQARGLSMSEYVVKLSVLHDHMRHLADSGEYDTVQAELQSLGLQTVVR